MTRAYLRLDPAYDERKAHYPDGPYAALIGTLCLAEHQPHRGRFRSLSYLRALLGRRGRHVPYLVEQGDVEELPDGRIYVVGWDEWQEGDLTVTDRMARMRNRRRNNGRSPDRNAHRHTPSSGSGDFSGDYQSSTTTEGDTSPGARPLAVVKPEERTA